MMHEHTSLPNPRAHHAHSGATSSPSALYQTLRSFFLIACNSPEPLPIAKSAADALNVHIFHESYSCHMISQCRSAKQMPLLSIYQPYSQCQCNGNWRHFQSGQSLSFPATLSVDHSKTHWFTDHPQCEELQHSPRDFTRLNNDQVIRQEHGWDMQSSNQTFAELVLYRMELEQ